MKGQMKRIVAVMLSIMMVFTLVPLSSVNAASKAKLNKKSATIYVGKTVQLKVNNNKKKVKWSTSNKKIAIVNKKGKVTGKKAGKVTITAKVGKKKYNCKVTVKNKTVVEPTNVPETTKLAEQPATSIEQSTTKPAEQPTTKPEQPSTNPVEETTTDNYGDSGEDWIVGDKGNNCVYIMGYLGNDKNIIIPNKINSKDVIGIGKDAFLEDDEIVSVELPDTICTIEENAFRGCTSLQTIKIPSGVSSIGESAFRDCENLYGIVLPEKISAIEIDTFKECKSLKNIVIPKNVKRIGVIKQPVNGDTGVFSGCGSLENITFEGESLKILGDYNFSKCISLKEVNIPNGATRIGTYAFVLCSNLTSVTIPDSVTSMDGASFWECERLTNIKGKKGSYAETWANDRGYTFIPQ